MAGRLSELRFVRQSVCVFFVLMFNTSLVFADHQYQRHNDHSSRQQPWLSTYLGVGLGFGGDEVGRFTDSDGYTESIHSGGGFLLEGGLNLAVDPLTSLRLSGGYQIDGATRGNGSSVFDRLRFDLSLLRSFGAHEFGAGLTAHTSVGFSCDINSICQGDVEFNHAVGYTFEYALRMVGPGWSDFGRGVRLGVRYTGIDYTSRLPDSETFEGDTLTGFVGVVF